jgi:hypothetical protein
VFVLGNPRHDTGNCKVEIVSLLSHGEGEAMVRSYRRKFEWRLGKTTRQVLSRILPRISYHLPTKGDSQLLAVREGVDRCSLGQVL